LEIENDHWLSNAFINYLFNSLPKIGLLADLIFSISKQFGYFRLFKRFAKPKMQNMLKIFMINFKKNALYLSDYQAISGLNNKMCFTLLLIIWSFVVFSCKPAKPQLDESNQYSLSQERPKKTTQAQENQRKWRIKTTDNEVLADLSLTAREAVIQFNELQNTLTGQFNSPQRAQYFNERGDITVTTRYLEKSLQLLDVEGKLLWQVSFEDNKMKISDTPDNQIPYEIIKNGNYFKVLAPNKSLGEVRFKDQKIIAKGFQAFETEHTTNHPAFGVLLFNTFTIEMRLILLSELLRDERAILQDKK
jgi:hypothetical protein